MSMELHILMSAEEPFQLVFADLEFGPLPCLDVNVASNFDVMLQNCFIWSVGDANLKFGPLRFVSFSDINSEELDFLV